MSADPFEWPLSSNLGKNLKLLEESLLCPNCTDFLTNAHSLNCGHSFCSLCIRRHLDRRVNAVTYNQCPTCRAPADINHLKPNRSLDDVVFKFKSCRTDLLNVMKGNDINQVTSTSANNNDSALPSASSSSSSTTNTVVHVKKLAQKVFHKYSKDKIKKELLQLCTDNNSTGIYVYI